MVILASFLAPQTALSLHDGACNLCERMDATTKRWSTVHFDGKRH